MLRLGYQTCALIILASVPIPAQDAPKLPRIVVMPLDGQGNKSAWGNPTDTITQLVGSAFAKTRQFELLERAQLGKVVNEATRQNKATNGFDESQAVELGKLSGAKLGVVGNYTATAEHFPEHWEQGNKGSYKVSESYKAAITVTFRLIDLETGKQQENWEVKGSALHSPTLEKAKSEALMDLTRKLDRDVANKYPVQGYILQIVSDKEYLIDLGKNANLAEGDEFAVVERGPDIVHPVTGKVIKGAKKVLTELRVTKVEDETAVLKIIGAKLTLKPGLAVESRPKKRGFGEAFSDFLKN